MIKDLLFFILFYTIIPLFNSVFHITGKHKKYINLQVIILAFQGNIIINCGNSIIKFCYQLAVPSHLS